MPGRIVVVGLGPAGPDLLTAGTLARLESIPARFLRTSRHPAATAMTGDPSFDRLYEALPTFEEVYAAIVEALVDAARSHPTVLYAVPGSPVVAERTVELLVSDPRVEVEIEPALSFLDLAWVRLGLDPLAAGVRIVDGHRFAADVAGSAGPFLVAQCHSPDVLSDIKLAWDGSLDGEAGPEVRVLHHLGLADELVVTVPWHELDRFAADHLTSIYIPALSSPFAVEMVRIEELMRTLRAGCPWDAQQTFASLAPYALEEAQELVEAIAALDADGGADVHVSPVAAVDPVAHLADELGDVLFQVLFHSCLAAEEGWFTLADVVRGLHAKLVRRHPHVFPRDDFDTTQGDHAVVTADDVVRNWERIKAAERAAPGRA